MRKHFITGLVILMPIILTIMLFIFLIDLFTDPFVGLIQTFLSTKFSRIESPIFIARLISLILLSIFILLLGIIARWFFFRSFIKLTQKIFSKLPVIKPIYKTSKDIITAFLSSGKKKAFTRPLMLRFPSEKSYSLGFETGEIPKECKDKTGKKLIPVFVPTAPHPISGYLLMVSEQHVHSIHMTNEEAIKLTVSCGLITPETKTTEDET